MSLSRFVRAWKLAQYIDDVAHLLHITTKEARRLRRQALRRGVYLDVLPEHPPLPAEMVDKLNEQLADWSERLVRTWTRSRTLDDVCRVLNWSPALVRRRVHLLQSLGVGLGPRPGVAACLQAN